jgi:Raf kinase inhibitor-like YbhB/YbcL family protein
MHRNANAGILLGLAVSAAFLAPRAWAEGFFTLTSTTFKDGQLMPRRVANSPSSHNPVNPNCSGENISPQLAWQNAPLGTKSFALFIEEPEGRGGTGTFHFLAYGIPATVTSFAEGELAKASGKFVGGKSSHGVGLYSGPCTTPGPAHHYAYVVIATDLDPTDLPAGLTHEDFVTKLVPTGGKSHALAATSIVGFFKNGR